MGLSAFLFNRFEIKVALRLFMYVPVCLSVCLYTLTHDERARVRCAEGDEVHPRETHPKTPRCRSATNRRPYLNQKRNKSFV